MYILDSLTVGYRLRGRRANLKDDTILVINTTRIIVGLMSYLYKNFERFCMLCQVTK